MRGTVHAATSHLDPTLCLVALCVLAIQSMWFIPIVSLNLYHIYLLKQLVPDEFLSSTDGHFMDFCVLDDHNLRPCGTTEQLRGRWSMRGDARTATGTDGPESCFDRICADRNKDDRMRELTQVYFARDGVDEALYIAESVEASDARVLVVGGTGRSFRPGMDLKAVSAPAYTRTAVHIFADQADNLVGSLVRCHR